MACVLVSGAWIRGSTLEFWFGAKDSQKNSLKHTFEGLFACNLHESPGTAAGSTFSTVLDLTGLHRLTSVKTGDPGVCRVEGFSHT